MPSFDWYGCKRKGRYVGDEGDTFPVSFLLKALAVSFGLWSGAIVWGVNVVTHQIDEIAEKQERIAEQTRNFQAGMFERVRALETWQLEHNRFMERELLEHDAEHQRIDRQKDR